MCTLFRICFEMGIIQCKFRWLGSCEALWSPPALFCQYRCCLTLYRNFMFLFWLRIIAKTLNPRP